MLRLSNGAVEDFVPALGCGVAKPAIYNKVQAARQLAGASSRRRCKSGTSAAIGADSTFVRVQCSHVEIEEVVDEHIGELLGLASSPGRAAPKAALCSREL